MRRKLILGWLVTLLIATGAHWLFSEERSLLWSLVFGLFLATLGSLIDLYFFRREKKNNRMDRSNQNKKRLTLRTRGILTWLLSALIATVGDWFFTCPDERSLLKSFIFGVIISTVTIVIIWYQEQQKKKKEGNNTQQHPNDRKR